MGAHRLIFIPEESAWRPTPEAAEEALLLFRSMVLYEDEVAAVFHDRPEFHTGLGNWSGVCCPACACDIEAWFFEVVSASYKQDHFENLNAVTPCCQLAVSLHDLRFGWPAGFSRFSLSAMDPGFRPTPQQIADIEQALGTRCRVIWEKI